MPEPEGGLPPAGEQWPFWQQRGSQHRPRGGDAEVTQQQRQESRAWDAIIQSSDKGPEGYSSTRMSGIGRFVRWKDDIHDKGGPAVMRRQPHHYYRKGI